MLNTSFNLNYRENSLFTEKNSAEKISAETAPFSANITEDVNSKGARMPMPGSTA